MIGDFGVAGTAIDNQLLRGAINSAANQGVHIAVGLQHTFSWAQVAGSAIAAPVVSSLTDTLLGETIEGGGGARRSTGFTEAVGSTAANIISRTLNGDRKSVV